MKLDVELNAKSASVASKQTSFLRDTKMGELSPVRGQTSHGNRVCESAPSSHKICLHAMAEAESTVDFLSSGGGTSVVLG